MQFWLGVVAGLSIGWLFDWLTGRRVNRADQPFADHQSPDPLDTSVKSSTDNATSVTATSSAANDAAVAGDAVDASD